MERMKRAVCLLLTLFMVVGMLPMGVFATEPVVETEPVVTEAPSATESESGFLSALKDLVVKSEDVTAETLAATGTPVVVVAASDYQQSGTSPKENTQNILEQIKKDYSSAYGFFFGGDYSQSLNSTSSTTSGINELKGVVEGVYGSNLNEIFVQGNHDASVSGLTATGAHDTDYYGVFSINEDDFSSSHSGSSVASSSMLTALESYLNAKVSDKYDKPIFVITHLPLHKTSRGDNTSANNIFNLLNEAGADGLNIIFMFGHNHSGGYDAYLGNGSIYLPKGSSITVAGDSTSTLNFTYMNYGYVGYVSGSSDTALTMTAFEIYEDEVIIKRYDASGLHNLKAAGATVSGYNTDANEYGYAVINLSTGESATYDLNGDSGDSGDDNTGSGDTGSGGSGNVYKLDTDGVSTGEDYLIVSAGADGTAYALRNNNGSIASAEVTISNGQIVTDATDIVWTYDENSYLSNNDQYLYLTNGSMSIGSARAMDISSNSAGEGAYTVKRTEYSYYLSYSGGWEYSSSADDIYFFVRTSETGSGGSVDTEGGDWVTITEPDGGTTTYTYSQATSITANGKYVIVGNEDDVALLANGTSMDAQDVTITGNSGSQVMTSTTELTEWTFSGTTSGTVYNGTNYLYSSSSSPYTFRIDDSTDTLYFADNGNDFTIKASSNRTGYSFYYDGSDWATSGRSTAESVRLFQLTKSEPGDDATPGLFAKITGKLEYNVERGLTADEVVALVKAEIKGYEYSGTAAPGDDVTGTEITEKLEFVMDSAYSGAKAGEYAVTIKYNDVTLGVAKVIVPDVAITGYDCQKVGSVKVGASGKTRTGANITVKLEDNTSYTVPVTLDMLSGNFNTDEAGSYSGLTVKYNDVVICEDFTLNVREPSSYPEYPDEGAVQVKKTGTGIEFQSTGVAQVEVSASGIPMNQGVDVLLILDTSSSMGMEGSLTDGRTRIDVLKECVNALIKNLKTERADGSVPDVSIAVVHFNGYTGNKNTNYIGSTARSTSTLGGQLTDGWVDVQNMSDTWANSNIPDDCSGTNYDHGLLLAYEMLSARQEAESSRKQFALFMSDGAPFQYNGVNSNSLSSDWENWILGSYNYSMDEEGNITTNIPSTVNNPEFYFGNNNGNGQKHRVAEAIKGVGSFKIVTYSDTSSSGTTKLETVPGLGVTMYSVGLALEASNMPTDVAGQEAILKTIASSEDVFYSVTSAAGLQAAFDDFAGEVLMAATNARFVDQMGDAYNLQMGQILDLNDQPIGVENKIEIISYDIWTRADYQAGKCTADKIGDRKGTSTVLETITFNADGTEVYSDKINNGQTNILADGTQDGFAKGVIYAKNFMYNTNSTGVAVNGVDIPTGVDENGLTTGSTNVLPAETFYWNIGTIKSTELAMRYFVYLEGSMEGTRKAGSYPTNNYANLYYNNYLNQPAGQPCQKETVSPVMPWKEANVSYAFYLVNEAGEIVVNQTTGETGSFANKIAVTNPVVYDTVLLNTSEEIDAVKAAEVLPNGYTLFDATYDAEGKITDGATYTVTVNSNATGGWNVTSVKNVDTTYVMHFDVEDASAYSKEKTVSKADYDYTHTVVWFAVVWEVQALPDSVVIDYGLPVDISVLTNDMFGENGKLAGVGPYFDSLNMDGHDEILDSKFGTEYKADASADDLLSYGDVKINPSTGKVRYTLNTTQMDGYDKFAYAVNYTGSKNAGYYYDTVTVIPATTIYYEDTFLNYSSYEWDKNKNAWGEVKTGSESLWTLEAHDSNKVQAEDRPGEYSLTDANNIYGYDAVNNNMSIHSLDKAAMVTVDYDKKALADFTFCGTGFDVVSMTSSETGTILVDVYPVGADGNRGEAKYNIIVDSYYGYDYCLCNVTYQYLGGDWVRTVNGRAENATEVVAPNKPETPKEKDTVSAVEYAWILAPDADAVNAIYQVPLIQVSDMPYGRYEVVITVSYDKAFDHHVEPSNENGTYDFYLDAVRIYDPANDGAEDDDTVIEDAYKADGEGWPTYIELREKILDAGSFDKDANAALKEKMAGLVFIDGDPVVGNDQIANYESYGPNNEVYLASGQSIAFILNKPDNDNVANVHIGIKSADGNICQYSIKNIARNENSEAGIAQGSVYHEKTFTVNTTTDMYYDLTEWTDDIIVITNTGSSGIISLTNIKSTYKSDPYAEVSTGENGAVVQSEIDAPVVMSGSDEAVDAETLDQNITYIYMTASAAAVTVDALNGKFDETPAPDASEPEETEPEATEPEVTEPEETEPEATEPETFEPEVSVKLNKTSVKVGQKVQVKVTTSADVAYVTVNGETVTNYSVNRRTGERTWSINITAEEAGRMNIEVIAYNGSDIAAEPVVKTVNVTKKSGGFFGGFFSWIFG